MPKYPPLTVERFISFDGGENYTKWEDCTPEQKKAASRCAARRLAESLQKIIDNRPEMFEVARRIVEEDKKRCQQKET